MMPQFERGSAVLAPLGAFFMLILLGGLVVADEIPDFDALTKANLEQTITDRRWLHQNPELSGREYETQAYLRAALEEIDGVRFIDGEWGTGVVIELKGGKPGPRVAWRADMDALPITEENDLPFKSTRRDTLRGGREVGVMHACGHDLHMSVTLGVIRNLSAVRDEMPGTMMFIFQPAEEIGAGAKAMLKAGVFDGDLKPECVLAFHDHPTIRYGQVGSCPGWSTANVDGFRLTVKGVGGHGAYPHRSVDPVTLAANMVLAFNDIVAREIDVNTHAVISVGKIEGGTKSNVIPSEVYMEATVRTHDAQTREYVKKRVGEVARGLAATAGAPEPKLDYYFGTPAGYNDPALVAEVREVFRKVLGAENEIEYLPGMGGEDFARFGQVVPGFQFRIGVAPPGLEGTMSLHSPGFLADERAVELSVRVISEVLWDQLGR